MSLLIGDNDTFDIEVFFLEQGNEMKFFSKKDAPENCKAETFTFKKPAWLEMRTMMAQSIIPSGGTVVLNPYVFMDMKIKSLLKKWTLKDDKDNLIKVTPENIDRLHHALCDHLSGRIDSFLEVAPIETKEPEQI